MRFDAKVRRSEPQVLPSKPLVTRPPGRVNRHANRRTGGPPPPGGSRSRRPGQASIGVASLVCRVVATPTVRRFFVIAAPVLLVAVGASMGFQPSRAGTVAGFLWAAGPSVGLAIFALAYAWRRSELALWLLPQWGDISRGFVAALALFGVSFGFVKLVVHESSPSAAWMIRLYAQAGEPSALRDHLWLVAAGIVTASFAEEIVWRGLVRSALEESLGGTRAWLAAALLYAAAHLPTMWALKDEHAGLNPMVPVAALAVGLAFGAMTRYYLGRLGPAMIAHAVFDWGVIVMFRLYGNSV